MAESRGRILVVDDELNVAQVLAEHLTEQGYEVATAHGGIEALAKIDLEKPQVILLDVRMPGMDGIEVLRRIRSFDTQVGILMISANEDGERAATPSAHNLLYDLALDIFRTARALSPVARESLGRELEQAALVALQRGAGGEKQEVVRALNQVRTLLRFAKDLADISDDAHRVLEASVARARRSIGLS